MKMNAEADQKILSYVLEAQRLTPTIKLAPQDVGLGEIVPVMTTITMITLDKDNQLEKTEYNIKRVTRSSWISTLRIATAGFFRHPKSFPLNAR
jgi:hypothetical protein